MRPASLTPNGQLIAPNGTARPGGGMDTPTKRDKPDKTAFASLFDEAFRWLAANNKLGDSGRHEAAFAKLCGSHVKNIRRWRGSVNWPNKDSWETARNCLSQAGLDSTKLEALCDAWSGGSNAAAAASHAATDRTTTSARPFEIVPRNPFPKLCSVNLDVPDQGSSRDDFIVNGELRFARAPDIVDNVRITVGVRRAVLLPVLKYCSIKTRSLYRPPRADATDGEGAEQAVFQAKEDEPNVVLEGDQLKGETLGRFMSTGGSAAHPPEVDILLQLETANDLCVVLTGALRGRSAAQKKLAESWIAKQLARTVCEPDGSLRIGACMVRWKREP